MRDLAGKWPAVPDWASAAIQAGGVSVRAVGGLSQLLVSGDLRAWNRETGMVGEGVGALALAEGSRYAVRVARDRLLAVSDTPFTVAPGWHPEGFAVTPLDAALIVFEIAGPGLPGIIARGTTLDPDTASPSASLLFAGIGVFLYRHGSADRVRLHVDRGLASYLWQWLEAASQAASRT